MPGAREVLTEIFKSCAHSEQMLSLTPAKPIKVSDIYLSKEQIDQVVNQDSRAQSTPQVTQVQDNPEKNPEEPPHLRLPQRRSNDRVPGNRCVVKGRVTHRLMLCR